MKFSERKSADELIASRRLVLPDENFIVSMRGEADVGTEITDYSYRYGSGLGWREGSS